MALVQWHFFEEIDGTIPAFVLLAQPGNDPGSLPICCEPEETFRGCLPDWCILGRPWRETNPSGRSSALSTLPSYYQVVLGFGFWGALAQVWEAFRAVSP